VKTTDFSKECLVTTEEYGAIAKIDGVKFESSLDDIVDHLGDKVLYMRTQSIEVCADEHYIHGM